MRKWRFSPCIRNIIRERAILRSSSAQNPLPANGSMKPENRTSVLGSSLPSCFWILQPFLFLTYRLHMAVRSVCPYCSPENNLGQLLPARHPHLAVPSLGSHQIFEDCPIKHKIIIEALAHEESVNTTGCFNSLAS